MQKDKLVKYMRQAVGNLLEAGQFENGWEFKESQREALERAYSVYSQRGLPNAKKLRAFMDLFTGSGKTAVFLAILNEVYKLADEDGVEFTSVIVEPTNKLQLQTFAAFDKFAPSLSDRVGFYGGGRRQLKKPITIITYDSWKALLKRGELGSHNVDFVIKDESHRGISEAHREAFNDHFDNRTLSIAFTATSAFDDEKTVELTHPLLIHRVPIAVGVQRDELAAYIHTQCYTIRVESPDSKVTGQFKRAAKRNGITATWELKKSAWNEHMLRIFREGRDEHTGDPLSDNKAGFFVFDTAQADEFTRRLNGDKTLKRKARELGCKGVAIAIHSKIKPPKGMSIQKEIERRFAAVENGEYMAVVGDEAFKEGWDYPELKVIFDYMRGSRVDEGQIIGRGTRPWENPLKGYRSEGLTVINSIIYMSSEDPEEDARRRLEARANAVIAADILGEAHLESPRFKRTGVKLGKPGAEGSVNSVFVTRTNSTCTMEDMDILLADRKKWEEEKRVIFSNYTIDDIKSSAIATVKATKRRPSGEDAEILYGVLKGKTTWRAVNQSNILKNAGYSSLLDFLNENSIGVPLRAEKYTIEDVIQSARLEYNKTKRSPTSKDMGKIQYGPLKGITSWNAVSQVISRGRLKDEGYDSLMDMLDKNKIGKKWGFKYGLKEIIKSAQLEYDATNRLPSCNDKGKIKYGPLKNKITWGDVQSALKSGALKKLGYESLYDALTKNKVGKHKFFTDYTIEDILKSARIHLKKTKRRPTASDTEKIKYGPLKGKISWAAVDKSSVLRAAGYSSLPDCLNNNGIVGETTKKQSIKKKTAKGSARTKTPKKSSNRKKRHYINPAQEQSWIFGELGL